MQNIYQHIDTNKRDTVVIVALFICLVSFLGWFLGEFYDSGAGIGFLGIALIISGLSGFISYYNSDSIVLAISSAKPLNVVLYPNVKPLVENMCIASGLPMPRIYTIDDTAMNAFATGRDPQHAVICLTTGLISRLEKRELEGVIAHEMAHIGNYDTRLMSIVAILVGTIVLISDVFTRGRLYKLGGRKSGKGSEISGIIIILGIILLIISPIIAKMINLAIGRTREYLADSTAALITRYPAGLASALRKIASDTEILEAANGATEPLYITSPLTSEKKPTFFAQMFDTHPPIQDRIKRLETM
jgi:heat shock protein HtpX